MRLFMALGSAVGPAAKARRYQPSTMRSGPTDTRDHTSFSSGILFSSHRRYALARIVARLIASPHLRQGHFVPFHIPLRQQEQRPMTQEPQDERHGHPAKADIGEHQEPNKQTACRPTVTPEP